MNDAVVKAYKRCRAWLNSAGFGAYRRHGACLNGAIVKNYRCGSRLKSAVKAY